MAQPHINVTSNTGTDDRYPIDKAVLQMVRMDPPDNLVYRRTVFTDCCPKANKRLLRRLLRECLGWQCKFIVRCVNVEWSDRSIRSIGQTFSRSDNYFTDGKKGRQRNKYMFHIPLFFTTIFFVFKNLIIILHAKQA